jgi:hypothetical protein
MNCCRALCPCSLVASRTFCLLLFGRNQDNFGQKLGGSFLNALLVLGGVFSFTIVFMLLFISTYRKVGLSIHCVLLVCF